MKSLKIKISVNFLMCDLPALVFNFTQFNGYYGCFICYHPGILSNKTIYYPYIREFDRRSNTEFQLYGLAASMSKRKEKVCKGIFFLSKIISAPSQVCIDAMHFIYEGVTKQF
jgi:hypothetical protein